MLSCTMTEWTALLEKKKTQFSPQIFLTHSPASLVLSRVFPIASFHVTFLTWFRVCFQGKNHQDMLMNFEYHAEQTLVLTCTTGADKWLLNFPITVRWFLMGLGLTSESLESMQAPRMQGLVLFHLSRLPLLCSWLVYAFMDEPCLLNINVQICMQFSQFPEIVFICLKIRSGVPL